MNATPQPQKNQTKSREILIGCRSIVIGFCETHSDAFLAEASQQLFEQASQVKDNNQQRQFFEASQYLEKNATKLAKHFESAIKQQFKRVFNAQVSTDAQAVAAQLEEELSLIKNSQMEIDVAITSMAHRVESDCAEELFGLTQRTAMLNKGIKLDEDETPYGPRFLCRTFFDFIAQAEQEQAIQLLLLKLFERSFVRKLNELYQELNRYLISSNVLPNLRYSKGGNKENPPRRRKTDKLQAESEQRQAELYQAIESILNSAPTPIDPAQPMMSPEQVLQDLLAMQQQPVQDIMANPAAANFPNTNTLPLQQALECISLLFDIVYSEKSLGSPIKNVLSHLRTPYARVALSDPSFLANPQHDARQLIHSLVQASERWTDDETDPAHELVQRIKTVVERVIADVSDARQMDPSMFGELLDEFNQYIDTFERKIKLTEQRNVQAAEGREKLKENQFRVEEIVAGKIENQELPAPVTQLIKDVWSSYMTYILLRHGEDSDKWEAAVATIDTLLWYIEPKTSEAETAKAEEVKASLHEILTEGMTNVGLDGSDIKAKLNGLELCRQLATENASDAEQSAAQTEVDQPAEVPPQAASQAIAKLVEPPAPDTATSSSSTARNRIQQQKASLEKPIVDETLQEPESDSPAKVREPTRKASSFDIERVLALKFGTWLDWSKPGENPRQVKLTWYNVRTQNCMLSNKAGKEIGMVTANTIALGMADGWIQVIEKIQKKPLFERMLEAVTGRSAKPDVAASRAVR